MTSIGDNLFVNCDNLNRIELLSNLRENTNSYSIIAFSIHTILHAHWDNQGNHKSVDILSYVDSIAQKSGIKKQQYSKIEIIFSISFQSFSANDFNLRKSHTRMTIPSSVTSIGDNAFSSCTSLAQITITSSVASIGEKVFDGCISLDRIPRQSPKGLVYDSNPFRYRGTSLPRNYRIKF